MSFARVRVFVRVRNLVSLPVDFWHCICYIVGELSAGGRHQAELQLGLGRPRSGRSAWALVPLILCAQ